MDPFAVIILGGTAGLAIALLLLGGLHPGSSAEQVEWTPERSAELEAQSDSDDLDLMLAATNARRRARGRSELTANSLAAEIAHETALARRRLEHGKRPNTGAR